MLALSLVGQMVKNLPAMQETWVLSLGWEDLLEKGMATHSSILAWRIPWTEKPGGPQSMGLQRVGYNEWLTLRAFQVAAANTGDIRGLGLIPGLGRSPGGEYVNPLQYPCLESSMSRGAWWATVHRATRSQTWLNWLSTAQLNIL